MNSARSFKLSKKTMDFLVKAGRQKKPEWLEKNKQEYEEVLRLPFVELAEKIKKELQPHARGYHFPSKGLARIKRPDFKVQAGQPLFKDWVSMMASRPSKSRFESTPHLFFGLFPNDPDHSGGLIAGGLWQPTSQQTRMIRLAIAQDAGPFHDLFKDRKFKARFKGGFYMKDISARVPRGFDADHEDVEWIKLKRFVVMKEASVRELSSPKFSASIVEDFRQALRFNQLLDSAIQGQWPPEN